MSAFVLLASERYSLPILRPVAAAATARGHRVAWLARRALAGALRDDEPRLATRRVLDTFAADATFATVHRVPPQLPGRQVQLFHGLSIDKRDPTRGHFRIRGLFDLYCTQGPATTAPFRALAATHGDFAVVETGWPKMDPLFDGTVAGDALRAPAGDRPVVMFASTFTESLSAAPWAYDAIAALVARGDRYWLLTLHPKCDAALVARYRALAGANAAFVDADRVPDMLRAADALVADTTSVVEEFALLRKPVVTLRHRVPKPFMIDIADGAALDDAIARALARPDALMQATAAFADAIHPSRDGHAATRVVAATEALLRGDLALANARRVGWWRRWQGRAAYAALFDD